MIFYFYGKIFSHTFCLFSPDFDIEDFIFGLLNDAINGTVNEEPNDKYIDDLFTTETANKETDFY